MIVRQLRHIIIKYIWYFAMQVIPMNLVEWAVQEKMISWFDSFLTVT